MRKISMRKCKNEKSVRMCKKKVSINAKFVR